MLIVIRTEDPLVGCPFFDFHAFWVTINCPHYSAGHRECLIIGIEVGIGQGLAAGGDGGVIGGASGGNFGEGNVYGNGGILVVLRIGLIIISNLHGYCNFVIYT